MHYDCVECGVKLGWRVLAGSQVAREPSAIEIQPVDWSWFADNLLEAGQGALAWRRVRQASPRLTPCARRFRNAFRSQTLLAADQEQSIEQLFHHLNDTAMAPLMIKGWVSARAYAEPGLRPYGDIDLCVQPDQLDNLKSLLNHYPDLGSIDLHAGVPDLPDRTWHQLWARSQVVPLGSTYVRILAPEDHLRLLAIHQIRHGAWRPLWLCDIAAALEARPTNFDWDYCLSGDRRLSRWVVSVIGLACRLLDARLAHPPLEARVNDLPDWLVNTVLWRWGAGRKTKPASYYLRHPGRGTGRALFMTD